MINKRNIMKHSLSMSEPGLIWICYLVAMQLISHLMKRAIANGIMSKYRLLLQGTYPISRSFIFFFTFSCPTCCYFFPGPVPFFITGSVLFIYGLKYLILRFALFIRTLHQPIIRIFTIHTLHCFFGHLLLLTNIKNRN